MLRAIEFTLQNLDAIASEIGWTRSALNEFYETNSYESKNGYVVLESEDGFILDVCFVELSFFNKNYMLTQDNHPQEVIKL